jgi:DNA-binding MarR family transcriptional regulator
VSPADSPSGLNPGAPLTLCLDLARAEANLGRRFDHRLGSLHGLSFGDFAILLSLGRAPEGRLRRVELAGQLGLTASGITRSLLPLEKIGLVVRQSDARDARVGYAALTPAGQALLGHALDSAQGVAEELLGGLSAEEVAVLARVLARLG